jgi:UDP-N-acetylmuramoylalanine--D-glutamate ligase
MQISEKYKGKKIAVLGAYGVEGVATQEYLTSKGLWFEILDQRNDPAYLEKTKDYELVFRTPGIRPTSPEFVVAKQGGTVFTSQIEEFFDLCPCKIIGITGTKGKGTTSTLVYEILKAGGLDVYLGGNIGVPAINFLDKLKPTSWVVLELSSFQLQTLQKSPNVAIVLNITRDHLDYHNDIQEYRAAKLNIVSHQTKEDFAVINDDYDVSRGFAAKTPASQYFFSREHKIDGCYVDKRDQIVLNVEGETCVLASFDDLRLRGRHNLENVTAASLAAYLVGVETDVISTTIKNFAGLEHRLELVRDDKGVRYYNDSFSTVPETAIAAIDSFAEPIILIAGGSDKKSDYTELGKKIASTNVKAVILVGDMAEEIQNALPSSYGGQVVLGLTTMNEIVEKAAILATDGDVVLLSPACASFGLFADYKDRGDQYKVEVNKL